MIHTGTGKLALFNFMSDVEKELHNDFGEFLIKEQGLDRPEAKRFQQELDIPLVPTQDDYFFFPFRHLSATLVGAQTFKATDFTKRGVVSKATELLTNKPAYLNHRVLANEDIGYIGETRFRREYTNKNGETVPGGIEGPFVIDGVLHSELVRKMLSPVSPITSASVTVLFNWEASHDFDDPHDFFWHLGEVIDDEMVRRMVVEIKQFEESSLVFLGADPYAKMLSDGGEVVNIDHASAFNKVTGADYFENQHHDPKKKYYIFHCLNQNKLLDLTKSAIEYSQHEPVEPMKKELLAHLAKVFNTTTEALSNGEFKVADAEKYKVLTVEEANKPPAGSFSKEQYETLEGEKTTAESSVTKLEGEKTTLEGTVETQKTEITDLKKFKDDNEEFAKVGETILTSTKEQAKKVYGIFANGKSDDNIVQEIEGEESLEKLNSKILMWGGNLVSKFGAVCTECNSGDNITFRSSVDPEVEKPGSNGQPPMAEGLRL